MNSLFVAALACSAFIMGEPVPSGDLLYLDRAVPINARQCSDGRCLAITTNTPDLWIVIGRRRHIGWPQAVHEACHRVQYERNGRMSEPECYAVQKKAKTCR